jgi:hypothetical protein
VKALHVAVAGALASAVTLSGIYTAAATAATTLAASIITEETERHSRSVEFSAMVDRESALYRTQASERKSTTTGKYRP